MKKIITLFLVLIILGTVLRFGFEKAVLFIYPLDYEEYILSSADENGLDPYLVMAVIKAESNYETDAHSGYASGLMQITDETAEWIASKLKLDSYDINNPETNIKMGCYYLKYLKNMYQDEALALASYNAGPGNVSKWLSDSDYTDVDGNLTYIPFSETREYVKRIEKYKDIYKKLYKDKIEEEFS